MVEQIVYTLQSGISDWVDVKLHPGKKAHRNLYSVVNLTGWPIFQESNAIITSAG